MMMRIVLHETTLLHCAFMRYLAFMEDRTTCFRDFSKHIVVIYGMFLQLDMVLSQIEALGSTNFHLALDVLQLVMEKQRNLDLSFPKIAANLSSS
ncbi:hypothetical protein TSUD_371190 [Trifolium subterraneum]|uniref:Uncharacterized protein n=1 Tax=Trifolium subterraneum TaxID=3900 RepID=A0A2Z6PN64_TRISU|nr:hypothetical protein TSUD_371190 [Trifolium subterraneum]